MTTTPNPALVTQRAAQRLPRLALLLFCAAYVLPGLFGRDPWRNADITAFGYMASIAQGHSSWLAPSVGGLPADAALLPYWIGAAAIALLSPLVEPAVAARLPFALLLVVSLAMTWYSTYHLARTDAAQPLAFAFGGEADPVDYARAVADGAVLALIATLGLLQLGHETTPELAQLASASIFLYAMAASPSRPRLAPLAVWGALPSLAASGAPSIALALGVAGLVISVRSSYPQVRRRFSIHVGLATGLAIAVASALGAWHNRVDLPGNPAEFVEMLRLFAWFAWPTLPLAAWTLWRWRLHWQKRHMSVPLACAAVAIVASILMGGVDRALMLALPALAVLGAFALPTLQRSSGAAIDWFSVFFFSICALTIWVIYLAVQTGFPARPAANVQRLLPGLEVSFSWPELALAVAGSIAWIALVFWRTGRHRHPLWKSMVLPASGVALCWLLLMSLWLPLLDYARSERPLVQGVSNHIPRGACVAMPDSPLARIAAIEQLGGYDVDAASGLDGTRCQYFLRSERRDAAQAAPAGWKLVSRVRRPTERKELVAIYVREPAAERP